MRVGSLVLWKQKEVGVVIEVPHPDGYWGVTAVVRWMVDGFVEEISITDNEHVEVLCE